MFGKKKCPRCDSRNLNKVKPSLLKTAISYMDGSRVFPFSLARKNTKPLNVCRDCGFSWEDR